MAAMGARGLTQSRDTFFQTEDYLGRLGNVPVR
jgi:hypothetical protein